ncbi:energy transducer TonB [Sphingobacterium lactis]|uniref:TonB protein C-terminal n=1 Tax=Sphingobacterium lactis TaxID=797291 RepID=A0A1H5RTA4_9SPHI|nr:energy transducer TonB [Sphingobacterium lactis]SEF40721.1 TonB protein C-terminal [Sphingobacterium lactis]
MKTNYFHLLLTMFLCMLSYLSFGQSNVGKANEQYTQSEPDRPAAPVGGMEAFREYVEKNYRFPKEALSAKVWGNTKISFVVSKTGKLKDFKVLNDDTGYGTAEELIRVVEESQNEIEWIPGIANGKLVNVKYSLPINLRTLKKKLRK